MYACKNIGKLGEDLAVDYLIKNRFNVLHRNWRTGRKEVDIIAQKGTMLHFIEVKTRKSKQHGFPEENVTPQKIKHMLSVATNYLELHSNYTNIQFDILSIILKPTIEYFFIEDVYL